MQVPPSILASRFWHCRRLSDDPYTPSRPRKEGVSTCFPLEPPPRPPTLTASSDRATVRSLRSQQQKSSESLSKTKVTVVTSSAKKYNGLQFPWTKGDKRCTGLCKNPPASQLLAAKCTHHRCQIEAVLTHDIHAWDQAAKDALCCMWRPSSSPLPTQNPSRCLRGKQAA